MSEDQKPLIEFESDASASILRYDLPSPSSYTGKNFIELDFDESCFNSAAFENPESTEEDTGSGGNDDDTPTNDITFFDVVDILKMPLDVVIPGLSKDIPDNVKFYTPEINILDFDPRVFTKIENFKLTLTDKILSQIAETATEFYQNQEMVQNTLAINQLSLKPHTILPDTQTKSRSQGIQKGGRDKK